MTDNSALYSQALWDPSLQDLKVREVNCFFVQTPDHFIQVISPVKFSAIELAIVQVLETNPLSADYLKESHKVEKHLVTVDQNPIASKISLDTPELKVDFNR